MSDTCLSVECQSWNVAEMLIGHTTHKNKDDDI